MRDIETYTWFPSLKERNAVEWIFFEDWKNTVASAMQKGTYKNMIHAVGITAVRDANGVLRPKLAVYVDRNADVNYILQEIGATRLHEYRVFKTSVPTILPLFKRHLQAPGCGFRNSRYRPVPVGCGTMGVCSDGRDIYGQPSGCSLGFFVRTPDGQLAFVSNNHCYSGTVCRELIACEGKHAVQPDTVCGGRYPNDVIGTNVVTKDYGSGTWYVDAAYATIQNADIAEGWLDADQQIHKWVQPAKVADPQPGTVVKKHGRGIITYSTTTAKVTTVSACVEIGCTIFGPYRRFCDQVITEFYIWHGDSGSSAWSEDMSTAYGLNFAGNETIGVFNRAVRVEQELGVKIITIKGAVGVPPTAVAVDPRYALIASLLGAVVGRVVYKTT